MTTKTTERAKHQPITAEEREARARARIQHRNIRVLAALRDEAESAEQVKDRLGLDKLIVCSDLNELVKVTSESHEGDPVAASLEIDGPRGTELIHERSGQPVRALDMVMEMPQSLKLGRIDVPTALGVSCMALFQTA